MLQSTNEFDTDTRFKFVISRPWWVAVCPDTGAILGRSSGRPKSGNATKYVLILPNETIEERGGLFGRVNFDDKERKFLRAWSEAEAIQTANEKLEKMLAKRQDN